MSDDTQCLIEEIRAQWRGRAEKAEAERDEWKQWYSNDGGIWCHETPKEAR